MQVIRFNYGQRGPVYGIVENDHVRPVVGDIFGNFLRLGSAVPLESVKLLASVSPSKILAMALNYPSHVGERPAPTQPEIFYKPLSCLIGPDEPIVIPKGTERVDYEGELVVVIGKRTKDVSTEESLDYVFGYTCGNDVSARDWQRNDMQWWRAKGSDTFGPVGPWITTDLDPTTLQLKTRVNGEEKQSSPVSELIYGIPEMISFASRCVTLEPGDVIFTGTPGTTSPLAKGDVVEVEISGIGVLSNPVDEA